MNAQTPEDCDRLFGERMNAGDVEGVVALYETDATFVPREGPPVSGTAAIRAAIAGFAATRPRLEMRVTKTVTAGDVAVLYNDWSMRATGPDGTPLATSGKALEVVRRQADGTWRFVVDDPFARG
jgi:uncharacterized protein (TIGR02246 family)